RGSDPLPESWPVGFLFLVSRWKRRCKRVWRGSQVARHGSAKPSSAVRFRLAPPDFRRQVVFDPKCRENCGEERPASALRKAQGKKAGPTQERGRRKGGKADPSTARPDAPKCGAKEKSGCFGPL